MSSAPDDGILPLARDLNERLGKAAPEVLEMLSALGRRLYFPKGILTQSAEAKEKAHRFNATIGIATEQGQPMHLPSIAKHLADITPAEAFPYAPPSGQQALRERWRQKTLRENPVLEGRAFGLPIVTSAITHGLMLVGDLFVDPGDVIVLPDKLWGNYRLTYEVRLGARIATYPFFAGEGYDTDGFARALEEAAEGREKVIALLNFPNNPTGYMPTDAEVAAIRDALIRQAERGTRVVAVLDDAYFGLFYHLGGHSATQSIFGHLVNAHPNLLAVRLDGATKEVFVWGLRCGFLTFGPGRAESADEVCAVLEA
jgi:aspartate/methionine/tyrosine aminotransferase